jgi:hypothetical protein
VRVGHLGLGVDSFLLEVGDAGWIEALLRQGASALHCSCYRRLPLLKSARARDAFVGELGKTRDELQFHLIGYVVMPEHVD